MPDPVKILLPFLDTSTRKVFDVKACELALSEDFIEYRCIAEYSDENEELGITTDKRSDYHFIRKAKDIANVSFYFDNKDEKFCIDIEFHGVGDTLGWAFDTRKEAWEKYQLLKNYFSKTKI